MNSRTRSRLVLKVVLATAALGSLALPGVFTFPTRPVEAKLAGCHDSKQSLDLTRQNALGALYRDLKSGAPFSTDEKAVLARYIKDQPISELEADLVASRAFYSRDTGGVLSEKQQSLLNRYNTKLTAIKGQRGGVTPTSPRLRAACTVPQYTVSEDDMIEIIPADTDIGNHCDDLTTTIDLPFPYRLYDQVFTTAVISSNGVVQFTGNNADANNVCLPAPDFTYSIFAHWDDLCTSGDCTENVPAEPSPYGIFTGTFGEAGDRVFVIEWRALYRDSVVPPGDVTASAPSKLADPQVANFEVRLFEGQKKFDIIYGTIEQAGCDATVGVQQSFDGCFTEYLCNPCAMAESERPQIKSKLHTSGASLFLGQRLTFTAPSDCTISCPENIVVNQSSSTDVCGANVEFPAPSVEGSTCTSAVCRDSTGAVRSSGDFFPLGTTALFCSAGDADCSFTITVNETEVPTITCPANITTTTDPNQCTAIVTYPEPTAMDRCPGFVVVCSPTNGTAFPKGTTTVVCTVTNAGFNEASCSFTITVNDAQNPTISCPENIVAIATSDACLVISYQVPVATDNCSSPTVTCNPPPGTCFPVGTTTVTCTTSDESSNTAMCSFNVTIGDVCLQDDGNPTTQFSGNALTGEYTFCCGGVTYSGTARVTRHGSVIVFDDERPDLRLVVTDDEAVFKASAALQFFPTRTTCTLGDRDTRNNSCTCSVTMTSSRVSGL